MLKETLDRIISYKTANRWAAALAVAILVLMLMIAATDVNRELRVLGSATAENMQWTLARGEVEAMALETEIRRQMDAETPDLTMVRLRFDILFSRFATLRDSAAYDDLRRQNGMGAAFARLGDFFDNTVPLIDGDSAALGAALPSLTEKASDAAAQFRQIALAGLEMHSEQSARRRLSLSETLNNTGLLMFGVLGILLVLLMVLSRVIWRLEDTTRAVSQMRDRAVAGEKAKADLLAIMSHEMRTPLNGMLGTLDLMEDAQLDSRHRQYLRIMRSSGETLLSHVNDVLDIARLDAGKMTVNRVGFDLVALLEEIVDGQAGPAQARGNALVLTPCHPDLHAVYGDPMRISQIVLNLVGNAIKFTEGGRITLEAACLNGLDEVAIRVIDSGKGIAEADLESIFRDFVTIDASYGRNSDGTGLGLGISRRLARAMDGEIEVDSVPGDGSVFSLVLPLAPDPHQTELASEPDGDAEAQEPAVARTPALDVLVVEDNATNRLVVRAMLERSGHRVTEAQDGASGVAAASAQDFDVILMDVSMPGMDGIEATRRIRDMGRHGLRVPIIATTAHALPDEAERFRAAGMDDVLVKPLSVAELSAALARAVPQSKAARGADRRDDLHETLAPETLERLLAAFRAEMAAFLEPAPNGETSRAALGAEAHRLAGSAGILGTERLRIVLGEAETILQDPDGTDPESALAPVRAVWAETRDRLPGDRQPQDRQPAP